MTDLSWLNALSPEEAEAEFLKCCGSKSWASRMVSERPFEDLDSTLARADAIWWSLDAVAWLEAFRSHPKIGEKKAEQAQSAEAKAWSEQEQSGTRESASETMANLAQGNREYAERFGYIFIVCATGKSAEEMLEILRGRLDNAPEDELKVAAEEQRKITQLRLRKLIGQN
jgi:OHCU decarboxylase